VKKEIYWHFTTVASFFNTWLLRKIDKQRNPMEKDLKSQSSQISHRVLNWIKNVKYILIKIMILNFAFSDNISQGTLKGQVFDSENQLPLIGANIIIKNTDFGAVSDINGYFIINDIPQNFYTISFSFIGYKTKQKADVWIRPNAYDFLDVSLEQTVLNFENIIVENSFFSKSIIDEFQSVTFDNDEIRRSPGSGQEISRILNSLPSVASVGENRQDMMVRGGGATENGFIVDNIHVPSISHFNGSDGRSNGPIGLINTDMVQKIDFYANGFPSKFGNKLSSYGEIDYKDGNNEKSELNLGLGLGGLGILVDGPLTSRSSYIASYRKSYLNIISDLINAGGLPSYNDFQGKVTFKANHFNKITILFINGNSIYNRDFQQAINEKQSNFGQVGSDQNTLGINFKHTWNKKAFSNTSFGYSVQNAENKFYLIQNQMETDSVSFSNNNNSINKSFRNINHQKLSDKISFDYGFEWISNISNYNLLRSRKRLEINENISVNNWSSFFSAKNTIIDKLIISTGLRLDQNDYENKIFFSPRINVDFQLFNLTNLIFNTGVYRQNPPEIYLSLKENKLSSIQSVQHSLSLERTIGESSKLIISIYTKDYSNAPLLGLNDQFDDPTFLLDELKLYSGIESIGESETMGLEVLLQKKRAQNFYGLVGGTFFNSFFKDNTGKRRNRNYNYQYIINVIGGYRPNNRMELSLRWSYFGGRPYSPINKEASIYLGEEVIFTDEFNQSRTPEYHSLFIRYEKRFSFKKSNLITYVELWNAYNRKNIETYFWSTESAGIEPIRYFDFIPIGGFELEF
tara:strand:- start:1938 stop:4343 length:2406 start_codon:yes stop_codon:yes gene_type:complete